MQPTTAITQASSDLIPGRFTIRSLFIWTLCVALPLACFRQYYALASNTADQRTTPLLQATPIAIVFFALGVISILAIVAFLSLRRSFVSAGALVVALTLCMTVGYPWLKSGLVSPTNGDPQAAQLHNDAAAVTAIALKIYYQRGGEWPKSWSELNPYLGEALATQQSRTKNGANAIPNVSQDLTIEQLPNLVEIDFEASPLKLSRQKWYEFSGIRPHKPSYNLYREEFQELIETIAVQVGKQ